MKLPAFIFSNKWQYRVGRHLSFWAIRILFLTVSIIARGGAASFAFNIGRVSQVLRFTVFLIFVCAIGFCYVLTSVLVPRFLLKRNYVWFGLFFLLDILSFNVVATAYMYWNLDVAAWSPNDRYL